MDVLSGGVKLFSTGYSLVSTGINVASTMAGYSNSLPPLQKINCEGFTSFTRIAMFLYKPDIKLKIDDLAINFEVENKIGSIDTNCLSRQAYGEGRRNFIIIKRIARIMLDLFPPTLIEKNKPIEPITNCYLHVIKGLEYIRDTFFSKLEVKIVNPLPNPDTFDFDCNNKKYKTLDDEMALVAIIKTINLFHSCCYQKQYVPKEKNISHSLSQQRKSYTTKFIVIISNLLDLLQDTQNGISVEKEWLVQHEFNSLNDLMIGRIALYSAIIEKASDPYPEENKKVAHNSGNIEEKTVPVQNVQAAQNVQNKKGKS